MDEIIFSFRPNIDLSDFKCFIKINDKNNNSDVIPLPFMADATCAIASWLLPSSITSKGIIDIQLQFEGKNSEIWQTSIVTLLFKKTIDAAALIEEKNPTVLADHEQRIVDIEKSIKSVNSIDSIDGLKDGINFMLIKEEKN